jgi:glycosyltransferase involved in cell wall biosynthesis
MKRVLFLAYLFPPIANSGTQRPLKFAKYLRDYGWEPLVLTAGGVDGHRTDASLVADLPPRLRVHRVSMWNERIGDTLASLMGGGAIGKRVGAGVRWRLQRRYRHPDLYACWRPSAVREGLRIFRDTGFDAIYATGFPWTAMQAGCDLSLATGRPLVVDFRDLWAGETGFRDDHRPYDQEHADEAKVIDTAARVVTTSATMTHWMRAAHPTIDESKFETIHNGFDPSDLDVPVTHASARRFRIVFTGVWKDGYNPAELYDTIEWIKRAHPQLLDRIEVVAAGFAPGEAARRGLSSHITEAGLLPHDDAVALMKSADVLYLSHVDPDRQWAIPGKIFEYLATGVPVLALTDPNRETAQIIRSVGGGMVVSPEDPGSVYTAIIDAARRHALVVPSRNPDALAAFDRRHLTAKLARVLETCVSQSPAAASTPRMSPAA